MPRTYLSGSAYAGSPRVFIATAAYSFHPNYTHSLARAMPALMQAGIAVDLCHIADHCHVDDARNAIVREFLMSKADALVFIDNDVGFEPRDLVNLCLYDRDVVGGVYPMKQTEEEYPVRLPEGHEIRADADGLVEVLGLPTGFLKIKRHVLEKLEANETRKFYGRGQSRLMRPHAIIFERTYKDGVRYSGDYAFCEKWKAMGGKLYVDPEMRFTHEGAFLWSGTLGDHWKRVHGVYEAENERKFSEAVAMLRAGKVTAEALAWLQAGWSNTKWAAQGTFLLSCYKVARKHGGPVLELGSGLSSIVMALGCSGEVHCLEHDPIWASKLHQAAEKYGITNIRIHLCPLQDYPGGRWYRIPELPGRFSFVVNDGPPRVSGNRGLLYELMGDRLTGPLLVDDADDEREFMALKAWSDANDRDVSTLGQEDRMFAISTRKMRVAA